MKKQNSITGVYWMWISGLILCTLLVQFGVTFLFALDYLNSEFEYPFFVGAVSSWLVIAVLIFLFQRDRLRPLTQGIEYGIRVKPKPLIMGIGFTLLICLCYYLIVGYYLLHFVGIVNIYDNLRGGLTITALLSVFFEEFFCRKYILDNMQKQYTKSVAVIVSVLFSCCFILNTPYYWTTNTTPEYFHALTYLVLSLLLTLLYLKYQSLLINIVSHILFRAMLFIFPYLLQKLMYDVLIHYI